MEKAALTTRDELLAVFSHDLRNSIGAIITSTQMLSADPSFAEVNSKCKDWIEFASRNAEKALRLMSDFLETEKFLEGKVE